MPMEKFSKENNKHIGGCEREARGEKKNKARDNIYTT
jgi:hypothetical protein